MAITNKAKRCFTEKTKLTSHYQDTSRKNHKSQINKILNEKGEVRTDNAGIQMIIRDY